MVLFFLQKLMEGSLMWYYRRGAFLPGFSLSLSMRGVVSTVLIF